jgi:hypothetical protein
VTRPMYLALLTFLCTTVTVVAGAQDSSQAIDVQRSSITIHVGKSGLLAAAGHEHWVDAPIASGTIEKDIVPSIRSAWMRKLSVTPEKGVNDKDQAEVQANMQTKVLESSAYPEVAFRSTRVRLDRDDAWKVSGELKLDRVTRSLTLDVALEDGAYAGTVRIKQTDFGIRLIKNGRSRRRQSPVTGVMRILLSSRYVLLLEFLHRYPEHVS